MANLRISGLPAATALEGDELVPVVQAGTTKQSTIYDITNYMLPTNLTVSAGQTVNLSDSAYTKSFLIRLTWTGDVGNMTLNLPSAANSVNRVIRIISNGGFIATTRVNLTPSGGDELDGSTSAYIINKAFEGIMVWSDGVEWFIIQKKA